MYAKLDAHPEQSLGPYRAERCASITCAPVLVPHCNCGLVPNLKVFHEIRSDRTSSAAALPAPRRYSWPLANHQLIDRCFRCRRFRTS